MNYAVGLVSFSWTCRACQRKETADYKVRGSDELPIPIPFPEGWIELDGRIYCPRHAVLVLIDGEPQR